MRSDVCGATACLLIATLIVAGCGTAPGRPTAPAATSTSASRLTSMSPDQGWAGLDGPVTGGAEARAEHIYRVRNRAELVAALSGGGSRHSRDTPKVVYVEGSIDLSVDAQNRPLTEVDYRDAEFSWDAYAKAYDPSIWGKTAPSGTQEAARRRSAERQAAVVVIPVGSNTSLIGVGRDALIKNGNLMVRDAHNVIIRNITFEDAYDYFPAWDPKDNANGEWNAEYDNVTLVNARRVWIDRCTFSDGARPDRINRSLFGRPMQFHDGLLDIIRGSDLVTVSYNHFKNHDKGLLIGNSDSRADDEGKLRVTMHHNWFEDVKERSPRVRYGRVHLYNNLYSASPGADYPYGYSIGVGFKSRIVAEDNVFALPQRANLTPFKLWRGERIGASGNRWADAIAGPDVDAVALLQRQSASASISAEPGWVVPYGYARDAVVDVAAKVRAGAGAGRQP